MIGDFWIYLEQLLDTSDIIIDRPKDSAHPRYPDVIYPLDYGYLDQTSAGDGDGIDVWLGTVAGGQTITGALATVDLGKRDVELKILVNCTETETQAIVDFYHNNEMGVHLIRRP